MSLPNFGANDENPFSAANVIARPKLSVCGAMIDATTITPDLLESLHEVEGIEPTLPLDTTLSRSFCGRRICWARIMARGCAPRPTMTLRTARAAIVATVRNILWLPQTCCSRIWKMRCKLVRGRAGPH